jgi:DNA-binding CsgD family transcriptional regulator
MPTSPLVFRQFDILERLCGGASRDDIASDLGLSARTVRHHLDRVRARLEVTSLDDACSMLSRGEIPEPRDHSLDSPLRALKTRSRDVAVDGFEGELWRRYPKD